MYHFGSSERRFAAELFLLEPGDYEVTVARAADDHPLARTPLKIDANNRRIDIALPPNLECLLRVTPR